jgi:hypothetical protein
MFRRGMTRSITLEWAASYIVWIYYGLRSLRLVPPWGPRYGYCSTSFSIYDVALCWLSQSCRSLEHTILGIGLWSTGYGFIVGSKRWRLGHILSIMS